MAARAGKRRSFRQIVNCDLELRPLMNVFIVLIPMLLMSAVFMEIRVIEMSLPHSAESAAQPATPAPFDVAIRIRGDVYVVEGGGVAFEVIPRQLTAGAGATPVEASATRIQHALAAIAAAHPDQKEVRIVAEARTRYAEIVALMDLARAAGLPQAALDGARTEAA